MRDEALETSRAAAVDRLILNYGHGKLSFEEFERRLDRALEAGSDAELALLTEDLAVLEPASDLERHAPDIAIRRDGVPARRVEHMVHIFAGGDRGGAWTVPEEIRLITIFGGADLDLSDAILSAPSTRIRLFCLFGGVDIYVPEGMNTFSKAVCLFGGIDNRAPSGDPGAPELFVEGLVMFGGVDIKVKKTLKQRLIEFAATVKEAFRAAT